MSRYCVIDRGRKILRPLHAIIQTATDDTLRSQLQVIYDGLTKAVTCGDRAALSTERGHGDMVKEYFENNVFGAANDQLTELQTVIDSSTDQALRQCLQEIHDRFTTEVIIAGKEAAALLGASGMQVAGNAVSCHYSKLGRQSYEAKAN